MTLGQLRLFAGHAAVALLVALSAGAALAQSDDIKLGEFIAESPPQPAPAISFTDMAGHAVSLADFKGSATLVNLWATWCQPCLKEMPSLIRFQVKEGTALKVIALSEDIGGGDKVKAFVDKHDLGKLPIYLDPKSAALHAFELRGLPTSVLVGKDGKVLGKIEGEADWDSDKIAAAIKPLLPPN
ncbi:MAG TPA: TlpA disulfide reductase family protein [Stellaceae bacterium]|jgi:thiol-disulfide isomerase/thioredoxin